MPCQNGGHSSTPASMESSCLVVAVLPLQISSRDCRDNSLRRANASSDTGLRFKSGSADQYSLKRPFSDVGSLIKESLVGGALRGR